MTETKEVSDRTFICVGTEQGELFLNLFQITRAYRSGEDTLIVHLSDGSTYNLHGKEAVEAVFALLVEHAMDANGNPLAYSGTAPKMGDTKITLIRPENDSPA